MNIQALEKSKTIANTVIIIISVIAFFINSSIAIGMLLAALIKKGTLSLGDKTGSYLTILFIFILALALYFLVDGLAVIGYVVAIGLYFLLAFFLYYYFDRKKSN